MPTNLLTVDLVSDSSESQADAATNKLISIRKNENRAKKPKLSAKKSKVEGNQESSSESESTFSSAGSKVTGNESTRKLKDGKVSAKQVEISPKSKDNLAQRSNDKDTRSENQANSGKMSSSSNGKASS